MERLLRTSVAALVGFRGVARWTGFFGFSRAARGFVAGLAIGRARSETLRSV